MSEKDRLFAEAKILKEKLENGDRSLQTMKQMVEILDRIEEIQDLPSMPQPLEAKPIV